MIVDIIKDLIEFKPELKQRLWIDPCAANGNWERAIRTFGIDCVSFDLEPLNESVIKRNFLTDENELLKDAFIIGNPPYSLVSEFINRSFEFSDCCYFLGGSSRLTGKISDRISLLHMFNNFEGNQKDRRSKIAFDDTLGKKVCVWTCGALIEKEGKFNRFESFLTRTNNSFRVGVQKYIKENDRIKVIERGINGL